MESNQNNVPVFVNDNFVVSGMVLCKLIHSRFSEELKEKTKKDKLKFNLVESIFNDQILNQLKTKELYFFKKTIETIKPACPIKVKSFLTENEITITEYKKVGEELFIKKQSLDKSTVGTNISDKITSISLKVNVDINNKNILDPKTKMKLSIADIMDLSKSDQLKLKLQIKCSAVFNNNCLYISGTLSKISLDESRMSEIYLELKEKENNKELKPSLLPRDKMFMSKYPKKSSEIVENVLNIISNPNDSKV